MQFDVSVQGHFYKVMDGENVGQILKQVTEDMVNNLIIEIIPTFDINQPHNVSIVPKENVS